MNRLDLTLRSTIHIQYANALAFDFFFFGSFFFTAVERKDTYRPLFSLRSKVFCMTRSGDKPPIPPKRKQCRTCAVPWTDITPALVALPLVYLRNLSPRPKIKAFRGFMIFYASSCRAVARARSRLQRHDDKVHVLSSVDLTPENGIKTRLFRFFSFSLAFPKMLRILESFAKLK